MIPIDTAVIPAAGLGTRFLPVTKSVPKEMLPIVDRPTIELNVRECVAAGITRIVIVNGRHKTAIENHFDHNVELESKLAASGKAAALEELAWLTRDVEIISVRQKQALGLGHAVACAAPVVGDAACAVLLGDDLVDSETPAIQPMMEHFARTGHGVVGVIRVAADEIHKYGVVEPAGEGEDGVWQAKSLVEKPSADEAPSDLAVIGRYVLPSAVWPLLAALEPGVGGERQLTDALAALAQEGLLDAMHVPGLRLDAGDVAGFIMANVHFALKRPELAKKLAPFLKSLT